jgi:hypothetical protein
VDLILVTSLCVNSSINFIRVGLFIARMSVSAMHLPSAASNGSALAHNSAILPESLTITPGFIAFKMIPCVGKPSEFAKSRSWLMFVISKEFRFVADEIKRVPMVRLFL